MSQLNFHGPIHFDYINSRGKLLFSKLNLANPDSSGIYIWGFMYHYDKTTIRILEPVDFNKSQKNYNKQNMKFIPYYVGKKEKGKDGKGNIYQRIKQHHNIRNGDATKYIRFSKEYMKTFFKDPDFPIKIKRIQNNSAVACFVCKYPSKIEYFNDQNCLKLIYPNIQLKLSGRNNTDCPITDQKNKNQDLPDTLSYLINTMNNFWFCYAMPNNYNLIHSLEELETCTFWSLKGFTISQTGVCPQVNFDISIINQTGADIFKNKPTNQLWAIKSSKLNIYVIHISGNSLKKYP